MEPEEDEELKALMVALGKVVREGREGQGGRMEDWGGLKERTLRNLEKGIGNPTAQTMYQAARALRLTLPELLAQAQEEKRRAGRGRYRFQRDSD